MAPAVKKNNAGNSEDGVLVEKPIEQLILDKSHGKYQVIEFISMRAKWLRNREELRHLNQNEILEKAMREVLQGEVSEEELIKLAAAAGESAAKKDDEKPARKK